MKKQEHYLNELLGSLGVFYIKLHQYHWYVEGPRFYTLHEIFEEMYDEVTADLDEVAERMLQLNQKPASTLKEYLELSFVKEAAYTEKVSAEDMVKATLEDYKLFVEKIKEGYDLFDGDEVTTDLLVGLQTKADKHIWMLEVTSR
ncbi:MAG TPA: DNA starvation/stationary phase protection protein [Erysipelothrix sp.]|jgi:starvation-inducible DNA-binding protein|nr:DNA starvation/stationary phase protection protein [Erysipelothrix sp.]